MNTPKIHIIHENQVWTDPLITHLESLGIPYENWFVNEGKLDLQQSPPEGIFYNRMSASSHTRDHRYAVELSDTILSWLEAHGRTVVNDSRALALEVRKTQQLTALNAFNIPTPNSIVANNTKDLIEAAKELNEFPFIVKPNRGGKGLGVTLYNSLEQLERDIETGTEPQSLDGILIVQQYIKPADGRITRVEIIGGQLYYAVSVDASGGFELCPADSCNVENQFCPADAPTSQNETPKFKVISEESNPDLPKYLGMFASKGISIGALEYATGQDGKRYVYDVNTNTNYNEEAESRYEREVSGMKQIAQYLGNELNKAYPVSKLRKAS